MAYIWLFIAIDINNKKSSAHAQTGFGQLEPEQSQ